MKLVPRFQLNTQCISLLLRCVFVLVLALAIATDAAAIRRNSTEITRESQQNLNLTNSSNIELGSGSPDIQPVVNITSTCNCSSSNVSSPVCGSDGLTYINECALQRKNCFENRKILVKSIGRCPFNCTQEKETITRTSSLSYKHLAVLTANCPTQSAKIQDLLQYPFVPTCSNDDPTLYTPVQHLSSRFCPTSGVYWCSTPDGVAIESSLSWGHKPDCGSRKGCLHEGVKYNDGEILKSSCGICECLNGSIKCISDFCNTTEGSLSDYQLGLLKSDILHLFHFQFQHRRHILIDLRHIRTNQLDFHKRYIKLILDWKFNRFDQNNNDNLEASETHHLIGEIVDLIGTKPKNLTSQLRGCMDETQNGSISAAEWLAYFTTNVCEGSGSNSGETSRMTRSASRNLRDSTSEY